MPRTYPVIRVPSRGVYLGPPEYPQSAADTTPVNGMYASFGVRVRRVSLRNSAGELDLGRVNMGDRQALQLAPSASSRTSTTHQSASVGNGEFGHPAQRVAVVKCARQLEIDAPTETGFVLDPFALGEVAENAHRHRDLTAESRIGVALRIDQCSAPVNRIRKRTRVGGGSSPSSADWVRQVVYRQWQPRLHRRVQTATRSLSRPAARSAA